LNKQQEIYRKSTMVNFAKGAWLLVAGLSCLSVGDSAGDSLNIELEVAENVDLSALGPEGLSVHQGTFDLKVDSGCNYLATITFQTAASDNMKNDASRNDYSGDCNKLTGSELHKHKRYWKQFKPYVYETTGFDHMSLYPRPCGLEPLGRRQPRYDVNFYTVPAHYRALWVCQTFDVPSKCAYQQPSFLGRGHFTVPRLYNNINLVPNAGLNFQPDPSNPEAHAYEGLLMSDQTKLPEDYASFDNPELDISTYDGDFASFRAIIPYQFISSTKLSKSWYKTNVYSYQTMPALPSLLNVTWSGPPGNVVTVYLEGKAQLCGDEFDAKKAAQEV